MVDLIFEYKWFCVPEHAFGSSVICVLGDSAVSALGERAFALVKGCGGGGWRRGRWMIHFNLFWNKQDDYLRKKKKTAPSASSHHLKAFLSDGYDLSADLAL